MQQDISDVAMLATLRITRWGANRTDKEASAEVAASTGANPRSVRVVKKLIPEEYTRKINAGATKARTAFYRYTLPWLDNGTRILPVELYSQFMAEFVPAKNEFDSAVHEFVTDLDAIYLASEQDLKTLYKAGEMPSADEVKRMFSIRCPVQPFSSPEGFKDFRVKLSEEAISVMQEDFKREMNEQLREALLSAYKRIGETVGKMVTNLAEYGQPIPGSKKRRFFHESMIQNVRDMADVLKGLNITNDPTLDEIADEILCELTVYDADDLKSDDELRESVRQSAEKIMEKASEQENELRNYFGV